MIRCRKCNAELTELARFCNVCGLPQNPQEPELEISTLNVQKALDTNSTNRCENCSTELPKEARFCAACGTAQTSKKSSALELTSSEPVIPASTAKDDKSSSIHLHPSKSVKPAQTIKTVDEQQSKASENVSIRSKTATRPPVLPSHLTSNGLKSFVTIQQFPSSMPELSSEPHVATTPIDQSGLEKVPEETAIAVQPKNSDSVQGESIADISIQTTTEHSTPTRTPGLIRPITPKSSTLSVIPSRPDFGGQTITSQQPQTASNHVVEGLSMNNLSTDHANGKKGISDSPTMDLLNPASFMATSKAAEQWRKSWRDRQYAEAGPAENVSRGQASIPTPLTTMQHNLASMGTMQKNDKKQQGKRSINFGAWMTIFLMICLIISLGAYILVSYIPNSPFGVTYVTPSTNSTQPTLTLVETTSKTIKFGQSIQLHGEYFGVNQTIIFLRDNAIPIVDTSGNNISSITDSQGAFNITIPTDSHWSTGSHSIEALDRSSNQNAFQTIQVIPTGTATTTSTEMSLTIDGKPTSLLTFKAVIGQRNPDLQQITITNTSSSPLKWTATTSTNNNLNWLMINDNNNYGQLAISQPHTLLISVNTVGLKNTGNKHYSGQILFTINNNQLLTLPVQLQIVDAIPEMVFSPSPIIAHIAGNTCQPGVTLTLINLGTAAISWAVNPDDNVKGYIKFVSNGQLLESGTLLPSGQPGDIIVLTLQCNGVQDKHQYHVSVYANQMSWSESVIIESQS